MSIVSKEDLTILLSQYKKDHMTPFIIEVLGTPNSGKTTAIQAFEKVLKRNDIKHKVIYEAAGRCKLKKKLSLEFNLWTLSETVKQLLEAYSGNYDIVICERGLLDFLCWCGLYYQEKEITEEEYHAICNYALLTRFVKHINCCYIMECSIEAALKRENLSGLLDITGTVVNESVIPKYNLSLTKTVKQYGKNFPKVMKLDTSELLQTDTNKLFVSSVLDYIKSLCARQ